MKFLSTVAVAIVAASQVIAQQLTINTPTSPATCIPVLLTWTGGTPPYFLTLVPANQPNPSPIIDFGQLSGTSLTWRVNVAAGTSVNLNLRDNTGALAQTAPFTIIAGSDTSCVGQNLSTSAGPTQAGPTGSNPPPATTPNTPGTTAAPGTTGGSPATTNTRPPATSGTGAPSTTSSGAALALVGPVGAAGAFAAAVLAALA